jgi:GTP pyrophosphokinase
MSHSGRWVEVQIRTKRMDEIAERGYAAHWKYKDTLDDETGLKDWLERIKEILTEGDEDAQNFGDIGQHLAGRHVGKVENEGVRWPG